MTDLRIRSRLAPADLEARAGKLPGTPDYDVLLTGPATVAQPGGKPLCVYLPGVLAGDLDSEALYDVLHSLRVNRSTNRGLASGTPRIKSPQKRSYTRFISSAIIGAIDPGGQQKYCRLTSWTGRNLPKWETLHPLLRVIARHLEQHVPARYAAQLTEAQRTHPAWVVPGTPFTTLTVNNSYATGCHTDKGDLDSGFSTIACLRRGTYTGGQLVFPEYRVAVDLQHGDLILMDAHEWHGNVQITCDCGKPMNGPCGACGAERISVVSYFRARLTGCGSPEAEAERAAQFHERIARRDTPGDTPG